MLEGKTGPVEVKDGEFPFYDKADVAAPVPKNAEDKQGPGSGFDSDTIQGLQAVTATVAGPNKLIATDKNGFYPRIALPVAYLSHVVKTNTQTGIETTFTAVDGLSVTISPSRPTTKILVIAAICWGGNTVANQAHGRLLRDSTVLSVGNAAGVRVRSTGSATAPNLDLNGINSFWFVSSDTPGDDLPHTYTVQIRSNNGSISINRSFGDADTTGDARATSSLFVIEYNA